MSWLHRLINAVRPGQVERDIEREITFHLAERADHLEREGAGAAEARRRARLQFGNPVVQRERTRDVDVAGWVDATVRNIRYAVRTLASHSRLHGDRRADARAWHRRQHRGLLRHRCRAVAALPFPDGDRLVLVTQSPGRLRRNTHRACAPAGLEPLEHDVRRDRWLLRGRCRRYERRTAGAIPSRLCHAWILRSPGVTPAAWAGLSWLRAFARRTDCDGHQRSPLAQPRCRPADGRAN